MNPYERVRSPRSGTRASAGRWEASAGKGWTTRRIPARRAGTARDAAASLQEPEGDGRDAVEAVPRRREQADGHVVRAEFDLPGKQEDGDRQDVRMDHAVKEPEDGHDPPILPPHPSRHRAGLIRPSPASH